MGGSIIAFINEDLPHGDELIKPIELRSEADSRMRAPTRVLSTISTSSLDGADTELGGDNCPCISLSEDDVSPHHSCM